MSISFKKYLFHYKHLLSHKNNTQLNVLLIFENAVTCFQYNK